MDKKKTNQPSSNLSLALGGGGAKGLAHIPLLEVIDNSYFNVDEIAGTSIGAVIGAFYAGGMPAQEIKKLFTERLVSSEKKWRKLQINSQAPKWYQLIGPKWGGSSLLKVDGFLKFLDKNLPHKTFEELPIPLKIVTTDFWTRQQVVFEKGDLLTAIQASISIAGLFDPVVIDKKVLVDGGAVNPVPFDLLNPQNIRVAIDVLGHKAPKNNKLKPTLFESLFNTYQIMEESIVRQKLHSHRPDLYLKPEIQNIRVLDFHKHPEIFAQTGPATEKLRQEILRWQKENSIV